MNIFLQMKDFVQNEVRIAVNEAIDNLGLTRASQLPPGVRFLTRKQTAMYLGIKVKTVDKWAANGKLKRSYIKGSPRFDREEIDRSFNDLQRYKRAA